VARWAMQHRSGETLATMGATGVVVWCLLGTSSGASDYAAWSRQIAARYAALSDALAATTAPDTVVIATHPSWVWRETGYPAVVLPDENAASVLSLAAAYHASVVVVDGVDGPWPDAAATTPCLVPMLLPPDADPITAYQVVCTDR